MAEKSKTIKLTITMNRKLNDKLEQLCKQEHRSKNYFVNLLIERFIQSGADFRMFDKE